MGEWDDLVKALDDFIKWGDYFFEKERKTKWEYAEDSDFEDSPKKTFGLNNVYLFKAKIIGGWMMRMYVLDNSSWGGEQDHERVLRELNSGNEWPADYRGNKLRGKWFLSDDSYVNGKFVGPWFYGGCIECVRWHHGFRYIANYDYPKIPPFICGDCGTCKACTD